MRCSPFFNLSCRSTVNPVKKNSSTIQSCRAGRARHLFYNLKSVFIRPIRLIRVLFFRVLAVNTNSSTIHLLISHPDQKQPAPAFHPENGSDSRLRLFVFRLEDYQTQLQS